ncbi:unnamed protein product [Owenia fusiformis]|uniref:Homologous recombination OB-fold protein OB-fold domain-containing protein n=1 Tax=Owenia fusiformis TaxID=6347 RepID=A0A8J1T760_OWEFU|nr:unnamed protein product [Owenia fusiformis]
MFKIQDDDDSFDLEDEDFLAAALEVEASQPKVTKKRSSFEIGSVEKSSHHPVNHRKSPEVSSVDLSSRNVKTKHLLISPSKKFKFKSTKDNFHNELRDYPGKFTTSSDSQESIVKSSQLSEEFPMDQPTRVQISAQKVASFLKDDSPSNRNISKNQQESESSPTVSPISNKIQNYPSVIDFNSDTSNQNSMESISPELPVSSIPSSNSPDFELDIDVAAVCHKSGKQQSNILDAIKPTDVLTSSAIFKISQDSYDSDLDLSFGESPLGKNTLNGASRLSSIPVQKALSREIFKAPQIETNSNEGRENQFTPTTLQHNFSSNAKNIMRSANRIPLAINTEQRPAQVTPQRELSTQRQTEPATSIQPSFDIHSTADVNKSSFSAVNNTNSPANNKVTNKEQHKKTYCFKNSTRTPIKASQPSMPARSNISTNSPSVLGQAPQRVRVPVTTSPARQPAQRVVTPISTKHGPRRIKRKFPGPAGILPKLAENTGFDSVVIPSEDRVSPDKNTPVLSQLSQSSEDHFGHGAWTAMTAELGHDSETILTNHNIATVLRKASKKLLPRGKVPLLCALIDNVEILPNDASVILKDPTGKIKGTIHRDVIRDYQPQLQAGTVLILRQAGVFSPSGKAHYLNITPNNLVRMYSKLSDGEINCASISELNIADLEKMSENVPESPMPIHSPMIGTGGLSLQNSPQLGGTVGTHSHSTPLFNTTPYQIPIPRLQNTPQRAIKPLGYTSKQNSSQAMRPPVCITPARHTVQNRSMECGSTTPLQGNIVQRSQRINGATPNIQQVSYTPSTNTATARRVNPTMLTPSTSNITTPKQRFNFKPVVVPSPLRFNNPGQSANDPGSIRAPLFEMKENTPVAMVTDTRQADVWDDSNIDDAVLASLEEEF